MKNYYIFVMIFCSSYSISQNKDLYKLDSIYHKNELIKLIDKSEANTFSYLTFYNFVKNESYFFQLKNNDIEAIYLTNKKFSKDIRCKKIKLSDDNKKNILKVLKSSKSKSFILDSTKCFKSNVAHYYDIEISIFAKKHKISSKCIIALKENGNLKPIFRAIDK
ncbi:protein of unknown function [Tenacibaculum sp. 190524A02b]|uniref:hypothetical protein n=1 Tax=Tenacibaculum vairaonense TaxID=3137860 RepID=UPI0032B2CABF